MRKVLYTLSTAALMLGGLTACNTDEGALDTRYNDNARPIGYYSNENNNDRNERNGNGYRINDNDGPLTEIMDRNGNGNNNRNGTRITNNNNDRRNNGAGVMNKNGRDNKSGIMNNNTDGRRIATPYNDGNPNTMGNNGHGQADRNYHSHLNDNNHRVRTSGYYDRDSGNLVQKITDRASKVKNVDDARAIVTEDNILVAVDTNDNNDKRVKDAVKKAVMPLAKGRNINIVTDEGTFTRVRDIDNDIRNGNTRESVDADIRDLFNNIGETLSKPFNNNNR
ncbi:YhcN/YlaJ family sporulation lipoprotein [Fredinandcohnia sp. 179-A 10B2 NHS]|uniref:YhcN/YlaJ family sporulation lipoprotein n=1 Tax=Fredinandcohnia sp. 179-A 10B2 NHS TaxID=3235176 RepID=UPI0039A29420